MGLLLYDNNSYILHEKGYDEYKNCLKCGGDIDYIGFGISKCTICGKINNHA